MNLDASSLPALPAGDTLWSAEDNVYYSYGPRRDTPDSLDVESCLPEEAQFYGVYVFVSKDTRWQWVTDVRDAEAARGFLNDTRGADPSLRISTDEAHRLYGAQP